MRSLLKAFRWAAGLLGGLWLVIALWGAFSPVVYLHYSKDATARISVFFNDNDDTAKQGMEPGQTVEFRTAMFAKPDMWILLTFPGESPDRLVLAKPFSRVEVYIGPGAKIERVETREDFFARL
ncbi:hypothetical protein [Achromobacter arsenitoxydans]|uniref:Uncharacterized protein n=1 Tax=Achromobacter arsenitoxydans SY8 TaxID=477184 RepID=H0FBA1_9BURK|nr:hypothetical protein [Achromobacter arsenitoxydans]EHK64366.1 hypothetical protein KYC_20289 [Achromobacter arsenitoxydans SY8]